MTNYEFNALTEHEKAEAVWAGTVVGDRPAQHYNVLLYQVDSFYVEVYYHMKTNSIKRFRSFTNTDLLGPYLHHVDLLQLLNA